MIVRRIAVVAVCLVFLSPQWRAFAATPASPEQSIRQVLADQVAAWNRGDVTAFMEGYADSPQTTFIGHDIEHGFRTILERYRRNYPSREAMGKLTIDGIEVRMLGSGYAVAAGHFHLARTAGGGGDASGVTSLVFQKQPEGWRIILDHSSN